MAENAAQTQESLKKEKKSLDPRIAFALMVIMVCCALCIGANKAWKKNRSGVNASYTVWQENIQQRVETGYNVLTVALRYLPEQDTLVSAVRSDLNAMEDSASVMQKRAAAGASFIEDAQQLLAGLKTNAAVINDSRDSMYVNLMLPQALEQCGSDKALNDYNDAASSYNSAMHSFSGLLARLTGISFAETVEINTAEAAAAEN